MFKAIFCDFEANSKNIKGKVILSLYRMANYFKNANKLLLPIGYIYLVFYKLLTEWLLGIEVHWKCTMGPRAKLFHGYGLVIHSDSVIGSDVTLRHGVTIGVKHTNGPIEVPVIGDNVDIGANASILGGIRIGNNVRIGAGAVVITDVPDGATVVGNPATIKLRKT